MEPTNMPLDPEVHSGEELAHSDDPNPPSDTSSSDSIENVETEEPLEEEDHCTTGSEIDDSSEDDNSVSTLTCESSCEGGRCDVRLVGTCQESCEEVKAVISSLKPQVVFLELCISPRTVEERVELVTVWDIIDKWKKSYNLLDFSVSWYFAKAERERDVVASSEFRVAIEEANKYGGKVILGDRPLEITYQRAWARMTSWHKLKLVFSMVFQTGFLPEEPIMDTFVHEKDRYMTSILREVASEHKSIVAVVGVGHIEGIKKNWEQPIIVNRDELLEIKSISMRSEFIIRTEKCKA